MRSLPLSLPSILGLHASYILLAIKGKVRDRKCTEIKWTAWTERNV